MKVIKQKQGRCVGGETNMKVILYAVGGGKGYSVRVLSGVHTFSKKVMCLDLPNLSLDSAIIKYYKVVAVLKELWEIDENEDNE